MIELWYNGYIAAIYEPVGFAANNCGALVLLTQYNNNGHTAWPHKQDIYDFSEANWDSACGLSGAKVRRYYRDDLGNLWRETDCDNFNYARFHGFMDRREHYRRPIWVADRSSLEGVLNREISPFEAARFMERTWQVMEDIRQWPRLADK